MSKSGKINPRTKKLALMTRAEVEIVAVILGEHSAAAAALKEADAHPGTVNFYRSLSSIIIEKLPVEE